MIVIFPIFLLVKKTIEQLNQNMFLLTGKEVAIVLSVQNILQSVK